MRDDPDRDGWIPAGAGETFCLCGFILRIWVDPRGGGGDTWR